MHFINVTWGNCTLRNWLNNEFYNNAFNTEQKNAIEETLLSTADNYKFGTKGGNDTLDNVFLLSIEEIEKYFLLNENNENKYSATRPTAYAINQGAGIWTTKNNDQWYDGNCRAWLRSSGDIQDKAAFLFIHGEIHVEGIKVDHFDIAVRPAVWINIDSEFTETPVVESTEAP